MSLLSNTAVFTARGSSMGSKCCVSSLAFTLILKILLHGTLSRKYDILFLRRLCCHPCVYLPKTTTKKGHPKSRVYVRIDSGIWHFATATTRHVYIYIYILYTAGLFEWNCVFVFYFTFYLLVNTRDTRRRIDNAHIIELLSIILYTCQYNNNTSITLWFCYTWNSLW